MNPINDETRLAEIGHIFLVRRNGIWSISNSAATGTGVTIQEAINDLRSKAN